MPNQWSFTWRASGSNQSNAATRTLTPSAPALLENYRRITSITRRNGLYCKCGGASQDVTIRGYDEILISGEVIRQSTTGQCRVYGTGPSSSDYMTTSFTDITVQESRRILNAWKAGTLQIRRTVWIHAYTSSGHGSPYFRSGYYNDDISIAGTDSAYMPVVELPVFSAADEERLYAETWDKPPFDFKVDMAIADSDYWEDPARLYRRLEITAENMLGESPAMETVVLENTALDTQWSVTQEDILFLRETDGFLRGSRYRVRFLFSVGTSADSITESASISAEIDVAAIPFHMSRKGNGVAIGKYSAVGSNLDERLFESAYPAAFHEGIKGVSRYVMGEEMTGGVWVDGKPIYRTVFSFEMAASRGAVELFEINGFETMIRLDGHVQRTGQNNIMPICFYYAPDNYNSVWIIDNAVVAVSTYAVHGYIVVEYTKRTEEEMSLG